MQTIILAGFMLLLDGFFIWLLRYCLRVGAVGGGKDFGPGRRDAHRDAQPIRYWTGIATLALVVLFMSMTFVFLVWTAFAE